MNETTLRIAADLWLALDKRVNEPGVVYDSKTPESQLYEALSLFLLDSFTKPATRKYATLEEAQAARPYPINV